MLQTHARLPIKSPPPRAHDAHAEQGKHDPAQVDAANNEAAARALFYLLLRGRVVALLLLIPFTYEPAAATAAAASGTTGAGCWRRHCWTRWRRAAAAGTARVQRTVATCCIKQGPCCCHRRGHVLLRRVLAGFRQPLSCFGLPLLADGHGCCLSLLLHMWCSRHSLVVVLDQDAQHEHEKGPKQGRPRTERASCVRANAASQHLHVMVLRIERSQQLQVRLLCATHLPRCTSCGGASSAALSCCATYALQQLQAGGQTPPGACFSQGPPSNSLHSGLGLCLCSSRFATSARSTPAEVWLRLGRGCVCHQILWFVSYE